MRVHATRAAVELDVVRFSTGFGQVGDVDVATADLFRGVLQRVEGRDDGQLARAGLAGCARSARAQGEGGD